MSFERPTGAGPEPAPVPASSAQAGEAGAEISPAVRLQILSTEHWSLLASRSLAWNESFSRAGMFLSTLTGAIVALALVGQASEFGEGFRLFALVILPVVLFTGLGTYLRMGMSNYHDSLCVVGMNRIRHEYVRLAPDVEHLFVMGTHDDVRGVGRTMGVEPGHPMVAQVLASTPVLVMAINGVVLAAIVSLLAIQVGAGTGFALLLGVGGFIGCTAVQAWYASRGIARAMAELKPMFPTTANE